MHKLVLFLAVVTALVASAPASAHHQASVNQLRSQIAGLRGDLGETQQALVLVNDKDTCTTAITIDMILIVANYVFNDNLAGIDDGGACQRAGIDRSAGRFLAEKQRPLDSLRALVERAAASRYHYR